MASITFTKVTMKITREQYPGYRYTHPNHPGREFALARASATRGDGAMKLLDRWLLYDVESGVALLGRRTVLSSRTALIAHAERRLAELPADRVASYVAKSLEAVMTAALRGLRK